MSKRLPYADRPTWQRVKDLSEAAMGLRFAVEDALRSLPDWHHPEMRDHLAKRLRETVDRLNDATGVGP